MDLGCGIPTIFNTLKILKVLPWQQSLPYTPQNLISSRPSWGTHTLKIGENPCMGLGCETLTNFKTKKKS